MICECVYGACNCMNCAEMRWVTYGETKTAPYCFACGNTKIRHCCEGDQVQPTKGTGDGD